MRLRIGIIGGTGLYEMSRPEVLIVETPYGDVALQRTRVGGQEAFFLARHGTSHGVAAHAVNHLSNIHAMASAHCDYVIGINNCGSLRTEIRPGTWTVLKDFVDFHRTGPFTYHESRSIHVSMMPSYCPHASEALSLSRRPALRFSTYAGTDGPRFETASEIGILKAAGAEVVGMTGVPEAVLAREKALCYAGLAFVGNYAAGLRGRSFTAQEIQRGLAQANEECLRLLSKATRRLPAKKTCPCSRSLEGSDVSAWEGLPRA